MLAHLNTHRMSAVRDLLTALLEVGYDSYEVRGCGVVFHRADAEHKYGDMPSCVAAKLGVEYQSMLSGMESVGGVYFNGAAHGTHEKFRDILTTLS